MPVNGQEPLVSVCCVTYNHEHFIRDALDGFVMQVVDFPLEIIIHDDASTDRTPDIIREYEDSYPGLVRAIYQTENQGSKGARLYPTFVWPKARGKYIAICDGDDYWTDPHKLQRQVDFLEAHPEYVLCFHDCGAVDESDNQLERSRLPDALKRDRDSEELILTSWIPTPTLCFRNVIREYPPEIFQVLNVDTVLTSILGQSGHGKYLTNIKPAAYRRHPAGVWSSLDEWQQTLAHVNTYYRLSVLYRRLGLEEYTGRFTWRYRRLLLKLIDLSRQASTGTRLLRAYRQLLSCTRGVSDCRFAAKFVVHSLSFLLSPRSESENS